MPATRLAGPMMGLAGLALGVATLAFGALSNAAAAQGVEFGPAVGAEAPAVALADQTGAARTLADLSGEKGATIVFVRSLDWCPVCQRQLIDLDARAGEFAERGYPIVAVTTDTPEKLTTFADRRETSVTLLADSDRAVIRAFGVVDPAFADREEGHRFFALPFPSTFVLAADGTVVAKAHEAELYGQSRGYAERLSPEVILAAIDAAEAGAEG